MARGNTGGARIDEDIRLGGTIHVTIRDRSR